MKIAIIQFPGSNCERETMLAVRRAGMEPVEFLWNETYEKLAEMQGYVIVGGFSYEDRSRAGIIAALAPIIQHLKSEAEKGKPILGICNGAQILVESGLVPGLENHKLALALAENKRIQNGKILGTGYYNNWAYLKLSAQYQRNAFTKHLNSKSILHVPVAHAEGRFILTEALLTEVIEQGLNVFEYCNAQGETINEFPINPNGSIKNIAAISNKRGNVMAIMPHPERTTNGDEIFQSMRDYINEQRYDAPNTLSYYPRKKIMTAYQSSHKTLLIELVITDNHALTVQNTLHQLNIPVTVRRLIHWEIDCETETAFQQIVKSGFLYNDKKEKVITSFAHKPNQFSFLTRNKEEIIGQKITQQLLSHVGLKGIRAISHGIVWHFSCKTDTIAAIKDQILNTNILYNPYAYECFEFKDKL